MFHVPQRSGFSSFVKKTSANPARVKGMTFPVELQLQIQYGMHVYLYVTLKLCVNGVENIEYR